MPTVSFLNSRTEPLADQVASALLRDVKGTPCDLSSTQVWVPTAGAARRIRHALSRQSSKKSGGVLSPHFTQPMQAMLDDLQNMASRAEREAAWGLVLQAADRTALDAVFPREESLTGERQLLGAGAVLVDLCDRLAEGGLDPASPEVCRVCEDDAERWEQLKGLFRSYEETLTSAHLADPNRVRLQKIQTPAPPADLKRIVVACVPDLPHAAQLYAKAMENSGIEVLVLVWNPGELGGGFDAWGRPLVEHWDDCLIPFELEALLHAKNPEEESQIVLDFLSAAEEPGDYALVLADPELTPTFQSEVLRRGGKPFVPDGTPLTKTEAGIVALQWLAWQNHQDLRTLRRLLECPEFAVWMGHQSQLTLSELLIACDELLAEALVETLNQAEASLAARGHDGPTSRLMTALKSTLRISFDELLSSCFGNSSVCREILEIWNHVQSSPVFKDWTEGRGPAFERALSGVSAFASSSPGDLELSGWLEAPWVEAGRLAISGCVEGVLPSSIQEHAFLPDSKRKALGLPDHSSRRSRDAYLLACLLAVRSRENFHLSFSKFGPDESPTLPSSLLLRCADSDLPARVQAIFKPVASRGHRPIRTHHWKWALTSTFRKSEIRKISPTDFSQYLACPLRFYFGRVLGMESFDPRAREMDALRFGSLIHKAVEVFAKEAPDETNALKIEELVLDRLASEAKAVFGPDPSPTVRVQLEAAKVRLRAFARIQSEQRLAGWKILDVERKLAFDDSEPLVIGPLPLSAKIDRIEEHPDHGLRILDYKTYASAKAPDKTHFGTAREDFPEAAVTWNGKARAWTDLQLPLYRAIAEKWYPGRPVSAAYFLLPSDPAETCIQNLDLSDELQASALNCAVAIATRIAQGVFWPPRERNPAWEDPLEALFLGGPPEENFDDETITFLKGRL